MLAWLMATDMQTFKSHIFLFVITFDLRIVSYQSYYKADGVSNRYKTPVWRQCCLRLHTQHIAVIVRPLAQMQKRLKRNTYLDFRIYTALFKTVTHYRNIINAKTLTLIRVTH